MKQENTFELHITVSTDNIPSFRQNCQELGIKSVILDLQDRWGQGVMQDVMTSSKFVGIAPQMEALRLSQSLKTLGYDVLRVKIETAPWNALVPTATNNQTIEEGQYFESHIRILSPQERLPALRRICGRLGAHMSRNVLKMASDGDVWIMATLRVYDGTIETFQAQVDAFAEFIKVHRFTVDKVEVEYAIYDSNIHHDASWIHPVIPKSVNL